MSTEQRETLDAILRQSAFPAGSDVNEQRRLLRELLSAQPLPADVTVTAATLGGVATAEITVDGIEPRHVVLYFHGGVYVMGDAFLAADLASQVGRRTRAKVISVDYRLAPEHPYPAAVDDALAAYEALLRRRHAPSDIAFAGEVSRRRASPSPPWSTPAITGCPCRRRRFVMSPYADLTLAGTTMRPGARSTRCSAGKPSQRPSPRLYVGTRRRSRPHQPRIRRPVRPAAPDHPGRNSRGSPRRRRPPRATRPSPPTSRSRSTSPLGVPHVFQAYHPILDEAAAALDRAGTAPVGASRPRGTRDGMNQTRSSFDRHTQ